MRGTAELRLGLSQRLTASFAQGTPRGVHVAYLVGGDRGVVSSSSLEAGRVAGVMRGRAGPSPLPVNPENLPNRRRGADRAALPLSPRLARSPTRPPRTWAWPRHPGLWFPTLPSPDPASVRHQTRNKTRGHPCWCCLHREGAVQRRGRHGHVWWVRRTDSDGLTLSNNRLYGDEEALTGLALTERQPGRNSNSAALTSES